MVAKGPVFSICIPAHDPFPLLEQALDSVVSQTFLDWEVIIVDDCSDYEVRSQLKKRGPFIDDKIKCIRLGKNRGPLYARRVAFAACRGSYVLCLDADDELLGSDVLERLYSGICDSGAMPDVVLFNAVTSMVKQDFWIDYKSLGFSNGFLNRDSVIRGLLETGRLHNLWSKAIKRELLVPVDLEGAVGLYLNEDRLEVAGVFAKAETFLLIDRPFYFYRQNPNSTTHQKMKLDYCRQQTIVEKNIANMFSPEFSLDGLYMGVLNGEIYNMYRLTEGRDVAEAADCFKTIAHDPLYLEACEYMGIRCLKVHRRLLLWLLNTGRFTSAAIAARVFRAFMRLVKAKRCH